MKQGTIRKNRLFSGTFIVLVPAFLSCAAGLVLDAAVNAQSSMTTTQVKTTKTTRPALADPSVWVGRNISAVVEGLWPAQLLECKP